MSHSHFCFSIPDVIKNDRLKLVAFDVIQFIGCIYLPADLYVVGETRPFHAEQTSSPIQLLVVRPVRRRNRF